MLNITKKLTTKNCYINKNNPKYIVIHETDNTSKGAGAERHATAMYNGNLSGTVHYYVDDKSIYQTLEHKHGAYAIGDNGNKVTASKYGIHNQNSINIEICVNPESNYDKAVSNVIDLVKKLMKDENISMNNIVRHYDATRKNCPRKIIAKNGGWDNFKNRLKETKKYTNCILYANNVDKTVAEVMAWAKEDCIVKNVKDHIAWEAYNLFVIGGPAKTELDKMRTGEKYTSIIGNDRFDTNIKVLKHIGKL